MGGGEIKRKLRLFFKKGTEGVRDSGENGKGANERRD